MPAFMVNLLKYALLVPGLWKKLSNSKGGLEALGLGMWGGSEALGQLGALGERKVARQGLSLQEKLAGAQTEAAKRLTLESRASSREQMAALQEERAKDRQAAREEGLMTTYLTGQQQQMDLLLAAMQRAAATSGFRGEMPSGEAPVGGGGIAGILRSNL